MEMLTLTAIAGIDFDDLDIVTSPNDTIDVPTMSGVFCMGKSISCRRAGACVFIECTFLGEVEVLESVMIRCSCISHGEAVLKKCIIDSGDYQSPCMVDSYFIYAPTIRCYRGYEDNGICIRYLFDESVVLLSGGGNYLFLWGSAEPMDQSRIMTIWLNSRNDRVISFAQIDERTAMCSDGEGYDISIDKRGYVSVVSRGDTGYEFSIWTSCRFNIIEREPRSDV